MEAYDPHEDAVDDHRFHGSDGGDGRGFSIPGLSEGIEHPRFTAGEGDDIPPLKWDPARPMSARSSTSLRREWMPRPGLEAPEAFEASAPGPDASQELWGRVTPTPERHSRVCHFDGRTCDDANVIACWNRARRRAPEALIVMLARANVRGQKDKLLSSLARSHVAGQMHRVQHQRELFDEHLVGLAVVRVAPEASM